MKKLLVLIFMFSFLNGCVTLPPPKYNKGISNERIKYTGWPAHVSWDGERLSLGKFRKKFKKEIEKFPQTHPIWLEYNAFESGNRNSLILAGLSALYIITGSLLRAYGEPRTESQQKQQSVAVDIFLFGGVGGLAGGISYGIAAESHLLRAIQLYNESVSSEGTKVK